MPDRIVGTQDTCIGVGLFDGSPLGKIELYGPDAADFLDLMYVGTMSTLPVGGARYGALLNENGTVVDNGIVARLGPHHFWVNTTSGGVDAVALGFEEWLQCEYVNHQVMVVPLTLSGYGTFNDCGDFLGGDWLEEVHEFFGEAFLVVVLAHLALIAALSLLRRKNQAAPMLTGRVEGAGPDLVKHNHAWLAALLLVAVLGYWAWEWQQSPNGLISAQSLSSLTSGQGRDRNHDDD